jgi:hypothetical protein
MTWFTWRQFRVPAALTAFLLAVIAILLGITGHNVAQSWSASGAATCHGVCSTAISNFLQDALSGADGMLYKTTAILMYILPALIGIFWGAPLIARELEAGTHRLAWNQSFTRTRWLGTKLTIVGGASAATVGLLTWAVTSWGHHVDRVRFYRITPLMYGARGIVPIAYALFAFALGVTMGMLIRRTVPAMAATLAIYAGAVVSMPLWIRAHLAPAVRATPPLDVNNINGLLLGAHNRMQVIGGSSPLKAWVLSNSTITASGHPFTGPANPQFCGPNTGAETCLHWIGTLGLRQDIMYQPASHFWQLQWTESGIFVALAVLLAGFCIWWTRRRLT